MPEKNVKNAYNNYINSFIESENGRLPKMNDSPFPQIPIITVDGVVNLLQHLDPHKATGPDGIPTYFLKELSYEITPFLTLIFQSSLY